MGPDTPQSETPFELPLGNAKDLSVATAVPQEAPQRLSRKGVGQLRRRHLTVNHSTVTACGDKFTGRVPSTNCFWCWDAFFKTSANLADLHTELQTAGKKGLESRYGTKFVKMFGRVLAEELTPGTYVDITEQTPYTESQPQQQKGTDVIPEETQGTGSTQENNGETSDSGREIQILDSAGQQA